MCINFGVARESGGRCHLRFDDTNPTKEDDEYVKSIKEDVRWLGWDWGKYLYFASDHFEKLYLLAVKLIKKGKAYVDDLSQEQIRKGRGTLLQPVEDSPYSNRSIDENLELFKRMSDGEFDEGARVHRAKIDMTSGNLNMRDPVLYRIIHAPHHRTDRKWVIYPMYDFAHGLSDSIERITHSLCTLEFEDHRPLYDWFIEALDVYHPQQIEFARLNISHTVLSKRKLRYLVEHGLVSGWDDPRMPTLSGLRRRGYTPRSIRNFCDRIGVAKRDTTVDVALLEHCLREDLNQNAPRVMGVLRPLKVVIDNYPEGETELLEAVNNPEKPEEGTRFVPFGRTLFIDQGDFLEDPPRKFYRLSPGSEVRLRYGYFITCVGVERDPETGEVVEVHCTYDPESRGGNTPDGRTVRGTIHWVSEQDSIPVEIRLYDYLFEENATSDDTSSDELADGINSNSLSVIENARVESSLASASGGDIYQFEREGYFVVDTSEYAAGRLVFNRSVSLRDTWARVQRNQN